MAKAGTKEEEREFLQIPMELEDWNMAVLDNLIKYNTIERDSFDFKSRKLIERNRIHSKSRKPDGLDIHLCAMANTVTGILVLGVDDPSPDNPAAPFRKNGFRIGTDVSTLSLIYNFVANVDPLPRVTHRILKDQRRFYVVLKVEGVVSQRPYITKDSRIFVRIGGSTWPATRATIANLFVNLQERRNSVRKLQVHCSILRNELILTAQEVDTIDINYTGIIPNLDLQSFRDACSSAEWFLNDQNLLGQVDGTGTVIGGLYNNIHELKILNTTIDTFNKEQFNRGGRYASFDLVLQKWKPHRNEFKNIIRFLDGVVDRCTKFLK